MRVANEMWQGDERVKLNASEIVVGTKENSDYLSNIFNLKTPNIDLTLLNGWTGSLTISKNELRLVHLRGVIYPGEIEYGIAIAKVPSGFIPGIFFCFNVYQGGVVLPGVYISTDGNILIRNPASSTGGLNDVGSVNINTTYLT